MDKLKKLRKIEIVIYIVGIIGIVSLSLTHNPAGVIWAICATLWAFNAFTYERRYMRLQEQFREHIKKE